MRPGAATPSSLLATPYGHTLRGGPGTVKAGRQADPAVTLRAHPGAGGAARRRASVR